MKKIALLKSRYFYNEYENENENAALQQSIPEWTEVTDEEYSILKKYVNGTTIDGEYISVIEMIPNQREFIEKKSVFLY